GPGPRPRDAGGGSAVPEHLLRREQPPLGTVDLRLPHLGLRIAPDGCSAGAPSSILPASTPSRKTRSHRTNLDKGGSAASLSSMTAVDSTVAARDGLASAVESVRARTDRVPRIALVLGSGLGAFADDLEGRVAM